MFAVTVILAILVGGLFLFAGATKLLGLEAMNDARMHLDVAPTLWRAVGALEVLGAIGVLLGLLGDLSVIGVLAAVGLVAMTIGATFYHQRAGDPMRAWLPAVVAGSLAIFYVIFRIGSA